MVYDGTRLSACRRAAPVAPSRGLPNPLRSGGIDKNVAQLPLTQKLHFGIQSGNDVRHARIYLRRLPLGLGSGVASSLNVRVHSLALWASRPFGKVSERAIPLREPRMRHSGLAGISSSSSGGDDPVVRRKVGHVVGKPLSR
jgi:hypothetical protein